MADDESLMNLALQSQRHSRALAEMPERIARIETDLKATIALIDSLIGVVERLQARQETIITVLAKITQAAGDQPK